jgi:hypothetical protein
VFETLDGTARTASERPSAIRGLDMLSDKSFHGRAQRAAPSVRRPDLQPRAAGRRRALEHSSTRALGQHGLRMDVRCGEGGEEGSHSCLYVSTRPRSARAREDPTVRRKRLTSPTALKLPTRPSEALAASEPKRRPPTSQYMYTSSSPPPYGGASK